MDSKVVKSINALWKNLMLYWLKLILNSDQGLAFFKQKQILTSLLVTKIYKNRTMKISLFNYCMLGYISPITTSLPHIYRRNSCLTHILKPTLRLYFKHHPNQEFSESDKFTIIWDLCRFLQPGLISSTIFCKKLDFLSVKHIIDI